MSENERTLTIRSEGMARGQHVEVKELPMNKIKMGRNSRMLIRDEDLSGMMQSINSVGLLQPIGVVRVDGSKEMYEIAYGNRRFMSFSRLGLHSIPAIVHTSKKEAKRIDVMNLTENVQRKNLSIHEIGRYAAMLEKEGLHKKELAVRLGVNLHYLDSCLTAYHDVPKEFRGDLIVNVPGPRPAQGKEAGKISMKTARAILDQSRRYKLGSRFEKELFHLAKTESKFNPESIPDYIVALKKGKKYPIKEAVSTKRVTVDFLIEEKHYDEIVKEHIENGPFNSLVGLIRAVLKGQKRVIFKIVD